MIVATWPWLALILLGAWHGLNPGMGWLFSVALVAWIIYDFTGLAMLRRSWINLDLIWCFSLLGAAAVLILAPSLDRL